MHNYVNTSEPESPECLQSGIIKCNIQPKRLDILQLFRLMILTICWKECNVSHLKNDTTMERIGA